MRSTFFGLNIGVKALQANQRALDVTSHNIANANTQGYARQEVLLEASSPIKVLQGYVGTGVDIAGIRQIRDVFLDIQLRTENKALGEWTARADILSKLEVMLNEPSDTGLSFVLDEYWEAWNQLSKNPESTAVRTTVMQRGVALVETFNHLDRQFKDLGFDINRTIAFKVDEINSLARQVSDLNMQIIKAEAGGSRANDLRDRRNLLIEQLSEIVDVEIVEDNLGALNVSIGGRSLVSRTVRTEIKFTGNEVDPTAATLEWIDPLTGLSQGPVRISGGQLKGYLAMRDVNVTELRNKISELAATIAEEVNAVHNAGFGLDDQPGVDFFVKLDETKPFSAGNIRVNQLIIDNINLIAAGKTSPVTQGDGSNALDMAQLRNKMTMNDAKATFEDFYSSTVAQLGVYTQEAERMVDNQNLLVQQIRNKIDAVSGVSMDEELVNMIKYEHAYAAAARVVNAMDEMLDLIINRLGYTGR